MLVRQGVCDQDLVSACVTESFQEELLGQSPQASDEAQEAAAAQIVEQHCTPACSSRQVAERQAACGSVTLIRSALVRASLHSLGDVSDPWLPEHKACAGATGLPLEEGKREASWRARARACSCSRWTFSGRNWATEIRNRRFSLRSKGSSCRSKL